MSKKVDEILKTICKGPSPAETEYDILVTDIGPNPQQYRLCFSSKYILELAESIDKEGLLEPISVRKNPNPDGRHQYQLVTGESRLRATILLGKKTIRARILAVNDDSMLSKAAAENIRRANGTVLDNANLARKFMEEKKGDIKEVQRNLPWGEKQIKRYLLIYNEASRTPEFLEIFKEQAADIDFTTAHKFSEIAPALGKLRKSNRREYNRAVSKIWDKGLKKALPFIQKKFSVKRVQTTKQLTGKQLCIETKEKGTCVTFSAMWMGKKPISSEERKELRTGFDAFLGRIGVDADSDDSQPINKAMCESDTEQI